MINTEKDKVKKRIWEKPLVNVLSFSNTNGGTSPVLNENTAANIGIS